MTADLDFQWVRCSWSAASGHRAEALRYKLQTPEHGCASFDSAALLLRFKTKAAEFE
jgi:hypothetical protein